MELTKGANTALPSGPITVTARWSGLASGIEDVDVSAFLLKADGRVSSDEGMVFYGQRKSADGAVTIPALSRDNMTVLTVDAARLAPGLVKVAIAATLTASTVRPFSDVGLLVLTVESGDTVVATFTLDTKGAREAAMIMGEIYERGGAWKFRAVGQGFNGGLQPLAENFGVTIAPEDPTPPVAAVEPPKPAPNPTPKPVNLSKVSLSKASPTISLEKKGGTLGEVTVNLNWNQGEPKKKGFFGLTKSGGIDLDLCCLFELADDTRFGVQALGNNFGNYATSPYIELAGDDRTGAVTGGEWMRINGGEWSKIRRILIYAMIYEGVPNWSATDGVVTLFAPGNPDVEVLMEGTSSERICAVVLLENDRGNLKITRENLYFKGAQEMDSHYGFNLSWSAGRK
jgi:tellurite resistance protein TerA